MESIKFNIGLGKHILSVELTKQTDSLKIYLVKLGKKYFILHEYAYYRKSDKWKIKDYSYDVSLKKLMQVLPEITWQIEAYFDPPPKWRA